MRQVLRLNFGECGFARVTFCGGFSALMGGSVTVGDGLVRLCGGLVAVSVGIGFFGEAFLVGRHTRLPKPWSEPRTSN